MPEREWDEILRLRDWRHDDVEPKLSAHDKAIASLLDRMGKVEPKVNALAARDELASALADTLQQRRARWYKRTDTWTAVAVAVLAAADLATKLGS